MEASSATAVEDDALLGGYFASDEQDIPVVRSRSRLPSSSTKGDSGRFKDFLIQQLKIEANASPIDTHSLLTIIVPEQCSQVVPSCIDSMLIEAD
ncbi:hypothetical protein KFK09_004163 [Dendrobium nobile]|uniref:Uncharacterized protein n=1 Tax=Dendrobium nobile TaxID=94219 RepID=A0A8T3C5E8_DENNO|nr:hypothetical protein KFK09_004163 [Dendrobium nobile]